MTTPEPDVGPDAVRIELPMFGYRGRVWVGSHEISGAIYAVHAYTHVNSLTEITLELAPSKLEMIAEGRGQFDTTTHEALIALGWTPPERP